MRKLTVCSPQLGISPESNSGGEVYDREVINKLTEKGIKFLCLLPKNRKYIKNKNLEVSYAPITHIFPSYIFNLFAYQYLVKTYKNKKFDIIRVHSPYFVGPAALLFKKSHPEIPVMVSYLHLEETSILQPFLDKIMINKFDHIITISRFTKKEIKKRFLTPDSKISIAYPGVAEKFKAREKNKILLEKFNPSNKKILLFLGGLKKRKNPLFLLKLIPKFANKAVLVIAGEGNLKNQMAEYVKNNNLKDSVIFTGYVAEDEKVNYYNLADIVLLPSLKEGFGMIAAEAQACGKPVIVSDNSSFPEVIENNRSGFLAKTNELHDWANKIGILLANEKLRREMGNFGAKLARKKFSWEENAEIHEQLFAKLLKR